MVEANRYLKETFLPWHNQALTKPAADTTGTAFIEMPAQVNLDLIFSIQSKRQVNADNTVQYKNKVLQIPKQRDGKYSFAGVTVTVHEHLDSTLSITYGLHVLGHYSAEGKSIYPQIQKVAA